MGGEGTHITTDPARMHPGWSGEPGSLRRQKIFISCSLRSSPRGWSMAKWKSQWKQSIVKHSVINDIACVSVGLENQQARYFGCKPLILLELLKSFLIAIFEPIP